MQAPPVCLLSLSPSISPCSLLALQIYDSAFFSLSYSLSLSPPLSLYLPLLHPLHSLLLKFAHFVLHMLLAYDFVLYPNKSVERMTIDDTYNRQATVIHCSLICCLQICVCLMRLSLERHSSFSIALINPCCSLYFPVRVFCFRCSSMQLVAFIFLL